MASFVRSVINDSPACNSTAAVCPDVFTADLMLRPYLNPHTMDALVGFSGRTFA
jgi:hypothetical protein